MKCHPHSHSQVLFLGLIRWVSREELGLSSFANSANGSINSRWHLEGIHDLRPFENICIIIVTLSLENWFNIHLYSRTFNNMQLGWQLLLTELIRRFSILLEERCITLILGSYYLILQWRREKRRPKKNIYNNNFSAF